MNPSKNTYPSGYWNEQQYRNSANIHSSSSYPSTAQQLEPSYGMSDTGQAGANYASNYYSIGNNDSYGSSGGSSTSPHYPHSTMSQQNHVTARHSQHYPSHSHPHSQSIPQSHQYSNSQSPTSPHGHTQSVSNAYGQPYMQSSSYSNRPRSHSGAHTYVSSSSMMPSQIPHPTQVPLSPSTSLSQHPATPARPYSCDLCALSFNRQHDLKRHRETHTGEKPYLCNGGCGKTFTRKDALKRHQLVKGCGKVDEGWS